MTARRRRPQPRQPGSTVEIASPPTQPPPLTERAPDLRAPPRRSLGLVLVVAAVGATAIVTTAWRLLRGEPEQGTGTTASGSIEPTELAPTKTPTRAKPKARIVGAACPPGTQLIPASRTCLDEIEVTVAAFDAWAGVASRKASHEPASVCTTKSDAPVNCVSFRQATDFCLSRSQRLPTESEWKRAAADWLAPSADASPASMRKRNEPAAIACVVDRTTAGICGLAGGVSELVIGTNGGQCVLGPADDSGAGAGFFRECRMPGWSADDAGSSCGFRCAADLP